MSLAGSNRPRNFASSSTHLRLSLSSGFALRFDTFDARPTLFHHVERSRNQIALRLQQFARIPADVVVIGVVIVFVVVVAVIVL